VIQVGAANGSTTYDDVVLSDFKLEYSGTGVHGIRVSGGEDNRIDNVTVEKISGADGSGDSARMGIQMLDGAAGCTGTCVLTRPVIINSRVFGSSTGPAYYTDGIHVTSDPDFPGVWGNDQGVINALVDGNNVDYIGETGYAFVGATDSSLFNNRATNMAASGGGFGIYVGAVSNINMTANVFTGSLNTTSTAIGVNGHNTGSLKEVLDSIFTNNVIDGTADGGVGFNTGFEIGVASNSNVHRNTFTNNVIRGASTATSEAIEVDGNADDNSFINNNIVGGTNAWDTGVDLGDAAQDGNTIRGNHYTNVTALIADSGTGTKIGVGHHRDTSDPTVNDDIGDGYGVGTLWINTSNDDSFLLTDSTTGAANWEQINGGGSGPAGTDLASVQARRTTDYTLTNAFVDITLNTTDFENDASVVEHDNTNTDQIDILEDGVYMITYRTQVDVGGAALVRSYGQLRVNDTTVIPGSEAEIDAWYDVVAVLTATSIDSYSAGDFITLQLSKETTGDAAIAIADTVLQVTKMEGIEGPAGGTGTLDDSYNNDTGERAVTVDDGDVSWDITSTYNNIIDLQGTGDFQIQNSGVNFAVFDDAGDITFSNELTVTGQIYTNATATKYLWLDIGGGTRQSAAMGGINGNTVPALNFDVGGNSRSRWTFPVPDDWEAGTDIEVEVFWAPEDATAGNVYWELDYQAWGDAETISGSTTLNSTEATAGTALELTRFTFTIPAATLATNDMTAIRLSREPGNAADTYANDINLVMVRINYTGKKLQ